MAKSGTCNVKSENYFHLTRTNTTPSHFGSDIFSLHSDRCPSATPRRVRNNQKSSIFTTMESEFRPSMKKSPSANLNTKDRLFGTTDQEFTPRRSRLSDTYRSSVFCTHDQKSPVATVKKEAVVVKHNGNLKRTSEDDDSIDQMDGMFNGDMSKNETSGSENGLSKISFSDANTNDTNNNFNKNQTEQEIFTKKPISQIGSVGFSVCSYNVLSQTLITANKKMYRRCNPHYLEWTFRKNCLEKMIDEISADIYCLQEVDATDLKRWFVPYFYYRGYSTIYKQKGDRPDGVLIAWKRSVFSMVSIKGVELTIPGRIVDPYQIGLIACLRIRALDARSDLTEAQRTVVVANTHLRADQFNGDVKLIQLAILLAHVKKLATVEDENSGQRQQRAVIMCGDFNSTALSPVLSFILNGVLFYPFVDKYHVSGYFRKVGSGLQFPLLPPELGIDESSCCFKEDAQTTPTTTNAFSFRKASLGHTFAFDSVYHFSEHEDRGSFASPNPYIVDHIFYSSPTDIQAAGSIPIGLLEWVRRIDFRAFQMHKMTRSMPNNIHGSDHFPVGAFFNYLPINK
ncbi:Protein angel -like protein 2 [Trichinella pseudospiralis]|uniref:Protein angel-like protein 2 n=1 Tax=Trichinella pseudospiralis TaxID=6337 RepID=A0A0V1G0B0_TRIPS|nr:Protein angel -like protein 2 [Trichinella pseudospiralis]